MMRASRRLALLALALLALASCSPRVVRKPVHTAPVTSRWPREWVLPHASAYGDTMWLASERPVRSVVIHSNDADAHAEPKPGLTIYGRSEGTPVAIRVPARLRDRTARQIIDGAFARKDLHLDWWHDPDPDSLATQEAGRFDNVGGRPMWGFDLGLPLEKVAGYRVIVVVIGRVDALERGAPRAAPAERWARTRTEEDPLPVLTGRWVRPYEIKYGDRFATVRVVADYDVDLAGHKVTPHVAAAAVRRWRGKPLR